MQGRDFIRRTDALKEEIENRHTREFKKLYIRISKDLINLLQARRQINFPRTFENYKPDYTALFRRVFADVRQAGFGFEIRQQLQFDKRQIIEIKKNIATEEQVQINDKFDEEYTLLLNNETEKLVSNDFVESEAKYFENIYNNSTQDIENFTGQLQKDVNKINQELIALAVFVELNRSQREKQKILQKRKEAFEKQITNIQTNKKREVLRKFKTNLEDKIPTRANENAEYGTGQATSKIKELEYTVITSTALAPLVQKIWWEKSQFIEGAQPRLNHLALSGTQSNAQGNFFVGGYEVPTPRDASLPASENARCRCEIEYRVITPPSQQVNI